MQKMDVATVANDHQLAIEPLIIFVSADETRQGELIGKRSVLPVLHTPTRRAELPEGPVDGSGGG